MSLSESDLVFIRQKGTPLSLKEGDYTFHDGDECNAFVLVTAGTIRVQKVSESGKLIVLYRVSNKDLCILTTSCLLGQKNYAAEGICETNVTGQLLFTDDFQTLMNSSNTFREFVFASLSERLSDLILKINQVALFNIDQRLANYLIQKKSHTKVTHQEIANEIGSAREVVSRHLKHLEQQGYIQLGHSHIEVLNSSGLLLISEGQR